jgi:hypothetical protein
MVYFLDSQPFGRLIEAEEFQYSRARKTAPFIGVQGIVWMDSPQVSEHRGSVRVAPASGPLSVTLWPIGVRQAF